MILIRFFIKKLIFLILKIKFIIFATQSYYSHQFTFYLRIY